MTGRRLYDSLTDAWKGVGSRRSNGEWLGDTPVAWAFLHDTERDAFNMAARKLTPKPRKVTK